MRKLLTVGLLLIAVVLSLGCRSADMAQASVIEVWEQGEPVPEPWVYGYAKQSMFWFYRQLVLLDDGRYLMRETWRSGNARPQTTEESGRWLRQASDQAVLIELEKGVYKPIDEAFGPMVASYRFEMLEPPRPPLIETAP